MLICSLLKSAMAARPVEETSDIEVHIITDDGFELIEVDRDRLQKAGPEDFCPRKMSQRSPELVDLLEGVPKLSDMAKSGLLDRFRTVEEMKRATIDDLMAVPGIGKATAQRIIKALNG
jgi:excinuclease ABC subunit C